MMGDWGGRGDWGEQWGWGGARRGEVDDREGGGRRGRAEGGADTIIVNGPKEL